MEDVMVIQRRITWALMLSAWIFQSCGEMELIAPPGLEIHVEEDTLVFAAIGDFGNAGAMEQPSQIRPTAFSHRPGTMMQIIKMGCCPT
jgi:hypothetical protein